MKSLVFLCLSTLFFGNSYCQSIITWSKAFGGNSDDYFESVLSTDDGGFICAGYTRSNSSFLDSITNISFGSYDAVIVKLNSLGQEEWKSRYGGSSTDYCYSIQPTSDGGYIACGSTVSNDGNVSGNNGSRDAWVFKLDSMGGLQWQKCFGGSSNEDFYCVKQLNDGGYICVGKTSSTNGDAIGNNGGVDAWLVRLNSLGVLQWQKSYGGSSTTIPGTMPPAYLSGNEEFKDVQQTSDGGFICAGSAASINGDVIGFHMPNAENKNDGWVVKVNSLGVIQWQKCLGGIFEEEFLSIEQASDGSFICSGSAASSDGDVIGLHYAASNNGVFSDGWIIKLSPTGNLLWNNCYGGTQTENFKSLKQTSDGGMIACGRAISNNGDVSANLYLSPAWVVKTNFAGDIEWQRCIGGEDTEYLYDVKQSTDGGFIFCGKSRSFDGDLDTNYSDLNWNSTQSLYFDGWVVKLSECNSSTATNSTINNTSCISYVSPSGNTYTVTGTYLDTIVNYNGCDSIITINLTINQSVLPSFTQVEPICYGTNLTALPTTSLNGIYGAWSPQPNNNQTTNYTFTPSNGQCASIDSMSIIVMPNTSSQITQAANNSYNLNGQTYMQSGTYTQSIQNANGCDSTITLNLTINNLGLEEELNSSIFIYPNPAINEINITYAGKIQKVEIMDVKGAKVYSCSENKKEIVLPLNMPTGSYLVIVHTPQGIYRKELVVEK